MNKLQIFESPKFGKIRTITEDGQTLFSGLDVANVLGYKNPHDALNRHCRWVVKRDLPHPQSPAKKMEMSFIPEGDLYRLAAKSELPGASEFESWIFDEVLPSIRRTGSYSASPQPKTAPLPPESASGVAKLITVIRLVMRDNGQAPEAVSQQ